MTCHSVILLLSLSINRDRSRMMGCSRLIPSAIGTAAHDMRSLRKMCGLGRTFLGSGRTVEYLSTPECRLQKCGAGTDFLRVNGMPEKKGYVTAQSAAADCLRMSAPGGAWPTPAQTVPMRTALCGRSRCRFFCAGQLLLHSSIVGMTDGWKSFLLRECNDKS